MPGGHGAAIKEKYWNHIAHFIVHGEVSNEYKSLSTARRSAVTRFVGQSAPIPLLLSLLFLLFLIALILWLPALSVSAKIAAILLVFLAVWIFITEI